jgi:hypothetical protein
MEQQKEEQLTPHQIAYRKRKEKAKKNKRPNTMMDPATGNPVFLPVDPLRPLAGTTEITAHVNKLQDVVLVQASIIAEMRAFFTAKRQHREVDVEVVERLAAHGANQKTIGDVLGFDWHILSRRRPDLEEAFTVGRAALKCALAGEQIQTAFGKHGSQAAGLMQIFLGKQLLDQKPDAVIAQTNLQVNVNTGPSELRKKIAEEKRKADEKAKEAWHDATVGDVVGVVADESEKSGTGS